MEKLHADLANFEEKFIHNYTDSLLFYHIVIRMPELEKTKEKLPYFPQTVLQYFKQSNQVKDL